MSVEAKRLDGSRCHLERGYRPQPRRHCVRWGPSSPKRGTAAPTFQSMSMAKRSPISATAELLYKVTTDVVCDRATYRSRQKRAKTLRHMGRDSSALRSELSLGHFGTSADLSGQFGPTKLVPKCPGSEVSWVRCVHNSTAILSNDFYTRLDEQLPFLAPQVTPSQTW